MNKPETILQSNTCQSGPFNFVNFDNKTYIKTEETSDGQVTLSEAQGHGMLIAARTGAEN